MQTLTVNVKSRIINKKTIEKNVEALTDIIAEYEGLSSQISLTILDLDAISQKGKVFYLTSSMRDMQERLLELNESAWQCINSLGGRL